MKKNAQEQLYFYKKIVSIPIYAGNFLIIFSNDIQKVEKTVNCKKEEIEELFAFSFHNFLCKGFESWAVCFNFWTNVPISVGVITHEITHVGNRILAARAISSNADNDEAEAYLNGWLANQVELFMVKCELSTTPQLIS